MVIVVIQFNTSHLFALSEVISSITHTYNFIWTQLHGSKYPNLTRIILFSIDYLFAHG